MFVCSCESRSEYCEVCVCVRSGLVSGAFPLGAERVRAAAGGGESGSCNSGSAIDRLPGATNCRDTERSERVEVIVRRRAQQEQRSG